MSILRQNTPVTMDGQLPHRQFLVTWNQLCQEIETLKEAIALQGVMRPGVNSTIDRTADGVLVTYDDGVSQAVNLDRGNVTEVQESDGTTTTTTTFNYDRNDVFLGQEIA